MKELKYSIIATMVGFSIPIAIYLIQAHLENNTNFEHIKIIKNILIYIINSLNTIIAALVIFIVVFIIYTFFKGIMEDENTERMIKESESYTNFLDENNFKYSDDNKKESSYKELELCSRFLENNPNNYEAIMRKADIYCELEKYDEAIKTYESNLYKINRSFKNYYFYGYAICLAKSGNKDLALNTIYKLYKNRKKDSEYYSNIAEIHKVLKEYDEAIDNYNIAIKHSPELEFYYQERAKIYKILNKQYEYDEDMKKVEEIIKNREEDKKYQEKLDKEYEDW